MRGASERHTALALINSVSQQLSFPTAGVEHTAYAVPTAAVLNTGVCEVTNN